MAAHSIMEDDTRLMAANSIVRASRADVHREAPPAAGRASQVNRGGGRVPWQSRPAISRRQAPVTGGTIRAAPACPLRRAAMSRVRKRFFLAGATVLSRFSSDESSLPHGRGSDGYVRMNLTNGNKLPWSGEWPTADSITAFIRTKAHPPVDSQANSVTITQWR